jgi:hypothetical protein
VQIYERLPLRATLRSIAHAVFIVPRTISRCLRQRARWPWTGFEGFSEVPLCEIREHFGIRVPHTSSHR